MCSENMRVPASQPASWELGYPVGWVGRPSCGLRCVGPYLPCHQEHVPPRGTAGGHPMAQSSAHLVPLPMVMLSPQPRVAGEQGTPAGASDSSAHVVSLLQTCSPARSHPRGGSRGRGELWGLALRAVQSLQGVLRRGPRHPGRTWARIPRHLRYSRSRGLPSHTCTRTCTNTLRTHTKPTVSGGSVALLPSPLCVCACARMWVQGHTWDTPAPTSGWGDPRTRCPVAPHQVPVQVPPFSRGRWPDRGSSRR